MRGVRGEPGMNLDDIARDAFDERIRAMMAQSRRERIARRGIRLPRGAGARWTRGERDG